MIYFDNAATTKMNSRVYKAMVPYLTEKYGNPAAFYSFSKDIQMAVDDARSKVAALIGADGYEIYFTSGGSESDNWAIQAVCWQNSEKKGHIITTKIEHHAVLNTCRFLERMGFDVTYVDVDESGAVSVENIEKEIREDTILISVMAANNEVGTIEPIGEIGRMAKKRGILFHVDAVQAVGHIDIDVKKMNIDMLSGSGHKLYGPKGTGFLYIDKNVRIGSLIHGGNQERGRRAGTLNVPAIVGLGEACRIAKEEIHNRMEYEIKLRDYMIENLLNISDSIKLNGSLQKRLPNNVNVILGEVSSDIALIRLDMAGICASAGSACTTGSIEPSHVLMAMGRTKEEAKCSLRFTISYENTKEEVDYLINQIEKML